MFFVLIRRGVEINGLFLFRLKLISRHWALLSREIYYQILLLINQAMDKEEFGMYSHHTHNS